jgi:hypothetical protein
MRASTFVSVGFAVLSAVYVLGCVVDDSSSSPGYAASGGSSGSSGGGASTQPMLVVVDPNQTMNASPGDGVGVFVQYKTGGHWDIWWTCDTNKTGQSCAFDNIVTVSSGAIANAEGQLLDSSDSITSGAQKIEVTSNTSTGIDGMTFDTPPTNGQAPIITLDAQVNGVENGGYLFFVQNAQINGGYTGTLTDPLMLEPKTP